MATDSIWSVGTASAARGQKARGMLPIAGTSVQMPITLIHGARPGPQVLITGGVHGG